MNDLDKEMQEWEKSQANEEESSKGNAADSKSIGTTDDEGSRVSPVKNCEERDSSDSKNDVNNNFSKFVTFLDRKSIINTYTIDDYGCGQLFHDTFNPILRYVADLGIFRFYNGIKWVDDPNEIFAHQCARALLNYLEQYKSDKVIDALIAWLKKRSKRKTMIQEAKSIDPLYSRDFDQNLNLFNCQNCTIDLPKFKGLKNMKDLETLDHNPAHFITKVANVDYDPEATSEIWLKHIRTIMCESEHLEKYIQTLKGYNLSGETPEEKISISYARSTRNGKGTTDETLLYLFGDYGCTLSPASISSKSTSSDKPSPEFARLNGVRFVTISEPDKGMKLNVALIKRLTGGDTISARYLRRNPIEFKLQSMLNISTNFLMEISDDTLFSSQRILMLPYNKHFEEKDRDPELKSTLRKPHNLSAILNWLLEGYKIFLNEGIKMPDKAEKVLEEYRKDCDVITLFLEDMTAWKNDKSTQNYDEANQSQREATDNKDKDEDTKSKATNNKDEDTKNKPTSAQKKEPTQIRLEKCNESGWVQTEPLRKLYNEWASDHGLDQKSDKEFVQALRDKGILQRHSTDGHIVKNYKAVLVQILSKSQEELQLPMK